MKKQEPATSHDPEEQGGTSDIQPREHCEPGNECGFIATERNRFFTGKFMTARDFRAEQDYFLSRQRMHNRVLHGWGILCGLRVTPHPDEKCRDRVVVGPGIAIDCCGRELVLQEARTVQVLDRDLRTRPHAEKHQGEIEQFCDEEPEPREYLVCIRYLEEEIDPVPVMDLEGGCDPDRREANRVREGVELEAILFNSVSPECWPVANADEPACCRKDCDKDIPGPAGICLQPECPCRDCVPLARISPPKEEHKKHSSTGYQIAEEQIDTSGRRQLPVPPKFLTHIVDFNWTHGGEISLGRLKDEMGGQLTISFDRKLLPADGDATGINPYTFIVQYSNVHQQMEFLPSLDDPHLMDDEEGCTAVFSIDDDYLPQGEHLEPKRGFSLVGNTVYVTLKCDFVLDCHGMAVDGNHLGGLLPTGNGTPGGVFESWFRIVHDHQNQEKKS